MSGRNTPAYCGLHLKLSIHGASIQRNCVGAEVLERPQTANPTRWIGMLQPAANTIARIKGLRRMCCLLSTTTNCDSPNFTTSELPDQPRRKRATYCYPPYPEKTHNKDQVELPYPKRVW